LKAVDCRVESGVAGIAPVLVHEHDQIHRRPFVKALRKHAERLDRRRRRPIGQGCRLRRR
jgi:hypothetical protein